MIPHPESYRRYRLYTEDKGNLDAIVAGHLPGGATIYRGRGVWRGMVEDSAIIEVFMLEDDDLPIQRLAHYIMLANEQDTVIITKDSVELWAELDI